MKYIVKLKYWNGWTEDYVWITRAVNAENCVEALKCALNDVDLEDEDIEEIDIYLN